MLASRNFRTQRHKLRRFLHPLATMRQFCHLLQSEASCHFVCHFATNFSHNTQNLSVIVQTSTHFPSEVKMLAMDSRPDHPEYNTGAPRQHQFYPYADNGGSLMAIAGEDYVIIGADTRLSSGFSILSRESNKLFNLTGKTVLASSGCWADTLTLTRMINARLKMYEQEHNKMMSTTAISQMLSTMLYYKRFFPYYTSNVLAGLDNDGKGCVYSYDPIGHCERATYRAAGSAGPLLQPLLDNQIGKKNMSNASNEPVPLERALAVLKDAFISAAERDIYTGDSIVINIITKDGIKEETFALRKD